MEHVMVPVPEEHLAEFQQAMVRLTLGQLGWDEDGVAGILPDIDARGASVLEAVARTSLENVAVAYRHVAAEVGIEVGELLDTVTEVNDLFRRAGLPLPLITDIRSQEDDDGAVTSTPTLVMVVPAARLILDWSDGRSDRVRRGGVTSP